MAFLHSSNSLNLQHYEQKKVICSWRWWLDGVLLHTTTVLPQMNFSADLKHFRPHGGRSCQKRWLFFDFFLRLCAPPWNSATVRKYIFNMFFQNEAKITGSPISKGLTIIFYKVWFFFHFQKYYWVLTSTESRLY